MNAMLAVSSALWKIIVLGLGLVCGAGLPVLFAIGLRLLSLPTAGAMRASEDDERIYFGNTNGAIAAGACFAIVLAAVGLGIYWIVST
jgi:hypothetical protein